MLSEAASPTMQRSLTQGLLQYRSMLFGFIYALVRDVVVAEEIFQEVAIIAMEKDKKGDEIIREPAFWLKEVARRLVHAGFRTRQGQAVNVDPEYLEQVADTLESDGSIEQQQARMQALGHCLEKISPTNQELLRQRFVVGASYEEIAKRMDRRADTLRVTLHRLRRQLADCVERKVNAEA
ncbi:MAG: hypothetical protein KatS3mg105_2246 [Gemmatales bacterium]|nr:MAG: hypothetical protein KatS3mg105_2246 [Gemmatales bacterium]